MKKLPFKLSIRFSSRFRVLLFLLPALSFTACSKNKDILFTDSNLPKNSSNELPEVQDNSFSEKQPDQNSQQKPKPITSNIKRIIILGTNDIHGGVEEKVNRNGQVYGGMALLGGVTQAIKEGVQKRFGSENVGTLLLDAGDQFQGTLLSNFSEGDLVFSLMNEIPYDAVVPGNHDYDFGPLGWLEDKVTPNTQDKNPRGALEKIAAKVHFPLLSANTFYKKSFRNELGQPIEVHSEGCVPQQNLGGRHFLLQGERPAFLKPYIIKEVAGVRVALVGIDHYRTASMTTSENVSDLCFASEVETYLNIYAELENSADVFVLMVHQGNSKNEQSASSIVEKILAQKPNAVHAVVAGHTHFVHNDKVQGVPIVQSGANSQMFGRIDILFDTQARKVLTDQIKSFAGVSLYADDCAPFVKQFCKVVDGKVFIEGIALEKNKAALEKINSAQKELAPISEQVLGVVKKPLRRDRIKESLLANFLTDELRLASSADIAILNTGGIRADLTAGKLLYKDFFEVLPFGNRAVILANVPLHKIISLMEKSAKTCGSYGALMQSGLKVKFQRNCETPEAKENGVDETSKILRIEDLSGQVLYTAEAGIINTKTFRIVTLDFLAAGGSSYPEFLGLNIESDLGIVRELLTNSFILPGRDMVFDSKIDGRFENLLTSD